MFQINQERYYNDLVTPFHKIHTFDNGNSIFLGSQSSVGGFPDKWNYTDIDFINVKNTLINNNINAIVCCAELYDLFPNDFKYLHIPMESNDSFDISEACFKGWNFINENINNGSVLVHCNAGCHRSATVVVGYLAKKLNMTVNNSFNYVHNKRHCINIDNFIQKLDKII
jgi:protein-tyrosine phosphatase